MSLNCIIQSALNTTGVLIRFQSLIKEDGKPDTYILFREYNQNGALFADNEEQETAHYIQLDLFSKGNYLALVKQVKQALKEVGFSRTFETEYYEDDTKYYHKVIRLSYTSTLN
jgi:hypothetical protein